MPAVPPLLTFHEWACIRTELYWAYDSPVPPDAMAKRVPEEQCYRVVFLRRGSLLWTTPTRSVSISEGMWWTIPHEPWAQKFSSDAELLSLFFICQWPSGEGVLAQDGILFPGSDCPKLEQYGRKLAQVVAQSTPVSDKRQYARGFSDYGTFLECQTLFFRWLKGWMDAMLEHGATLNIQRKASDERPLKAASYLNHAPLEDGFPKDQLLAETGLSEVQLNRLFLNEFGLTLRRYWDNRRLQEAKALLETSSMPIKEISYLLGFVTDSHFVTWFRRMTGKKPGDYRKEMVQSGYIVPGSAGIGANS